MRTGPGQKLSRQDLPSSFAVTRVVRQTHHAMSYTDERLKHYKEHFATFSLEQLVEAFNREVRVGLTGVREQGIYIIALAETLHERTDFAQQYERGHPVIRMRELAIKDGKVMEVEGKGRGVLYLI
jgi:hypothetical protein